MSGRAVPSPRRLEELSEARQGMVARVKAGEREREGLEGAKAAAEAYLARDRECTATHAAIYQLFMRDGQVPPRPATTPSPGSTQPALPYKALKRRCFAWLHVVSACPSCSLAAC